MIRPICRFGLKVYPRVCGGTGARPVSARWWKGLSPRVRGNRISIHGAPFGVRSIPACAGEPRVKDFVISVTGVYPRVCGGTSSIPDRTPTFPGLSPRVRGNPRFLRTVGVNGRSIPACAGEPPRSSPNWKPAAVYPRVCGGTLWLLPSCAVLCGLSPRVRGNRPRQGRARVQQGSIPACAGEPAMPPCYAPLLSVYPRVCGGTAKIGISCQPLRGLSPRVRGNRGARRQYLPTLRSIPACAGEPPKCHSNRKETQVYPRVCGGTGLKGIP